MQTSQTYIAAAICAVLLAACATPMPPSGGPPDRTPPEIVLMEPESGSVNVDSRTVRFEFSKWVDQRSFETALDVTPEPPGNLDFRWRRRSIEITFPDDLTPNTTYVLNIGTEFRDFGGNRLTAPITIAFSTGPTINRGRIAGRVLEPERGLAVADVDVYAYRQSSTARLDSLPARPDYRTQSGEDGRFAFDFLSEEPFFVLAIRDGNRNFRIDPGEEFAIPPTTWLVADSVGTDVEQPWITATLDLLPPEVTRVRALSDRRLEVRYNEPVHLTDRDPDAWVVQDSSSGVRASVADVYGIDSEPRSVFIATDSPLPNLPHSMTTGAVADSSGNVARASTHHFVPLSTADTLSLRFLEFVPDSTAAVDGIIELDRDQMPGVRFSMPPSIDQIRSLVSVIDTASTRIISDAVTDDGTAYGLLFEPELTPGDTVAIQATPSEAPILQRFRQIAASETGEISGMVAGADTVDAAIRIELFELDSPQVRRSVTADSDGSFTFTGIPGGDYRLRYFVDRDGSGAWTGGSLEPFRHAEPIGWWNEEVVVRPRWETTLPEPLSFSIDALAPPPSPPATEPIPDPLP